MSEFEKIKTKTRQCSHYYDTKKMIKLLILIDELNQQGNSFIYNLGDDVDKYGEEVVFSTQDYKNQVEDFLQIEEDLQYLFEEEDYEIKNLIETLLKIMKKEGKE